MNTTIGLIIACIAGYLLGSANTSLIVGWFYKVDVRKHGSGNAGATNTLRTLGKTAAIFVSAGDMLKGVAACLIGMYLAGEPGIMAGGTAAVVGHNWPLYFGFKGGKGIFTSLAVILMADWRIGLILLGVFLIVVAVTRYVSLGSMLGAVLLPVAAAVFGKNTLFIVFSLMIGALAVFMHRANIARIFRGAESRLGDGKNR